MTRLVAELARIAQALEDIASALRNRDANDGMTILEAQRIISDYRATQVSRFPPVVYFATRGAPENGDLVKIGFTRNLKSRMREIDAVPLATEPGGREREAALHKQFAHLRVRGEWFTPAPELMAYIEKVALHGAEA